MQQQNNQQKLNVNVSEQDIITCICGGQAFTRTTRIAKVKNPIIGQKDIIVQFPPDKFICVGCGRSVDQIIKGKENDVRKDESMEKA